MPEGDTVYRTASALRAGLVGKHLRSSDFRIPTHATADLSGAVVPSVISRGKYLLIRTEGEHGAITILSHLKMEGAWRVVPTGSRITVPGHTIRVVLSTKDMDAVGYSLGQLELLPTGQEADRLAHLGPDLLGPDWDTELAVANLTADPARPIGLALLDQRVLAGVGNVYRNELCFLRGIPPTLPVGELRDPTAIVALSRKMLYANKDRSTRCTTGNLRPGRNLWVYGRDRKPCYRCGQSIRRGELGSPEDLMRITYWCPYCQAEPGPSSS